MSERKKLKAGNITGTECLKTDWQTPPHLVEAVRAYFGGQIPIDAATSKDNPTRAWQFFSPEDPTAGEVMASQILSEALGWLGPDGLEADWSPKERGVFINPPYGKGIYEWVGKIAGEAREGCEIVALLSCTRWEQDRFQSMLREANAVCWIRKRVAFRNPATGDMVKGNPYGNMFLGFNVTPWRWREAFGSVGMCAEWRTL